MNWWCQAIGANTDSKGPIQKYGATSTYDQVEFAMDLGHLYNWAAKSFNPQFFLQESFGFFSYRWEGYKIDETVKS